MLENDTPRLYLNLDFIRLQVNTIEMCGKRWGDVDGSRAVVRDGDGQLCPRREVEAKGGRSVGDRVVRPRRRGGLGVGGGSRAVVRDGDGQLCPRREVEATGGRSVGDRVVRPRRRGGLGVGGGGRAVVCDGEEQLCPRREVEATGGRSVGDRVVRPRRRGGLGVGGGGQGGGARRGRTALSTQGG
jgi:hypothetical protein